ncbi:MAG TPA: MFS transporter [Planctomycetaceae bacterium]|nr:MFS transporter [Planctomycetaceae bacterium]
MRNGIFVGIHVGVAALMMVATFPGRTQGLGMVTEALLADFQMDRTLYASYNLWATLLGSLFCLPAGYWLDRLGCKKVLAFVLATLGAVVLWMSSLRESHAAFFIALLLTRGLGQSALSVASIALVSKYFQKRQLGLAMGVYSLLTALFFMVAFGGMGAALRAGIPWREAWGGIGVILIAVCLPIVLLSVRRPPGDGTGDMTDGVTGDVTDGSGNDVLAGMTCRQALWTPAFWIFALAASFYGLVVSGIGLFNESILAERGFDTAMYHRLLVLPLPFALFCNVLAGYLCRYVKIHYVLAGTLFPMSVALFLFPLIRTDWQVYCYAFLMSGTGGAVTVLFFSAWAELFGRREVGRIQGVAQMATVFASAVGPLLFALSWRHAESYTPVFFFSGGLTFLFAVLACRLQLPKNA